MKITGNVHKYGSNVDTDVIIPARYLNEPDHKALASHCGNLPQVRFGHL